MRISWQGRRSDKRHVDAHSTVCERRILLPLSKQAIRALGRSHQQRAPRMAIPMTDLVPLFAFTQITKWPSLLPNVTQILGRWALGGI